jgi:hypothetical protein
MRRLIVAAILAGALTGCGGADHPAAAPKPTAAARPAQAQSVLYVWRNFEETGIPEEATIYADGTVRYRNLLHTQHSIKFLTGHLPPAQLAGLRRLLDRIDLARADASGEKPRRDGYRWVLRRNGQVGTAADGHLHGTMRVLLGRLGPLMDRLRSKSL